MSSSIETRRELTDGYYLISEYVARPVGVPAPAIQTHTVFDASGVKIGVVDFPSYAPILIDAHERGEL